MAAPLTTVKSVEPDQVIDPGEAVFDPEEHARRADEKYQREISELRGNQEADIRRIQEDSDARTKAMRDEIDNLRKDLHSRPVAPPEPKVSLEDKYRISAEDQENYGDMLGVVDARAGLMAEKAATAAFNQASQLFESREQKLVQEMESLRQQVNTANAGVTQNFEASARARAANYGLELETLPKDDAWNKLMEQPISAVSDMTYQQYVTGAIEQQDMRGLEQVFKHFAEEHKRPTGPTLTGLPSSNRKTTETTQHQGFDDQPDSIIAELEALDEKKQALRDDITRRRISIDEFAKKNNELDDKIMALRRKLN